MKCQKANKYLSLFAGDDLPVRKKKAIEFHLESCAACAAELKDLMEMKEFVHKIGRSDLPDSLQSDFPEKVTRLIQDEQRIGKLDRMTSLSRFFPKHVRVAGGLAIGILLITAALFIFYSPSRISSGRLLKGILSVNHKGDSTLVWDPKNIFFKAFEGPFRLDSWEAPKQSGVYAVMHKKDPEIGPGTFVIDYCGQGKDLSLYRGYPWIHQRMKRLISRTGSSENVYIAVFLMPDSSVMERMKIEKALLKTFNPYFNRGA